MLWIILYSSLLSVYAFIVIDIGQQVTLSHEHSGFTFQPDPAVVADMISFHSGGKCSEALLMAQKFFSKSQTPAMMSAATGAHVPLEEASTSSDSDGSTPLATQPVTTTLQQHTTASTMKQSNEVTTATTTIMEESSLTQQTVTATPPSTPEATTVLRQPMPRRRSKREKEPGARSVEQEGADARANLVLLPPQPEKKHWFCCFNR
jgi:hypothetical protein